MPFFKSQERSELEAKLYQLSNLLAGLAIGTNPPGMVDEMLPVLSDEITALAGQIRDAEGTGSLKRARAKGTSYAHGYLLPYSQPLYRHVQELTAELLAL
ncbi:hypothetical protein OHT93_35910 [Streptomyces sp. NBC_00191]|uniref:hypothetical protein n=1 Tax=Streptomyces sp. NBC_00191 TaxID=2975674 RepID=UPI0032513D7A